ncbi:MAG: hypothetical protein SOI24_03945 [Coriobacteriales bacterium]|jgi:hypothetical protein
MEPSFGGAAVEVRPDLGYGATTVVSAPGKRGVRGGVIVAIVLLAIAAAVLVCVLVGALRTPVSGVIIDENVFPDAAFRAVVRMNDQNGDGVLSPDEIAQVTTLDCSDRDISSLQGISNLTALAELNASGNRLTTADLSGNPGLTDVTLADNQLTQVNLSNLSALVTLDVSGNQLTALDTAGCAALETLVCTNNQIARLDLSANVNVRDLAIDPGQNLTIPIAQGFFPDEGLRSSLSTPEVDTDGDGALSQRERESLTRLTVSDPSTASLDGLTWFPSLTTLDVSGTQVSELDGTKLPQTITTIKADGAQVSSVSLETLRLLISLSLRDDPVSSLDLGKLTALTSLDVTGTALTSLDITPVAGGLTTLYVDDDDRVTGGVTNTSACFADEGLRQALFGSSSNNPNGDDLLSVGELGNITSLDLSSSGAKSLSGISQLTSLKTLNCSGLDLGSVSCEGLSTLQSLYLSGCSLTSIDLTGATSLTTLDVSNNSLTSLVATPASNLQIIVATNNPGLTSIDIRGCSQITDAANVLHDDAATLIQTDEDATAFEQAQAQASQSQGDASQQS